jgi:hypothetical protein
MQSFRLEFYLNKVFVGCQIVKAYNQQEARDMSKSLKISRKDENGNFFDHRKLSVKVVPLQEKKEIKAEVKPLLEDKFNWY